MLYGFVLYEARQEGCWLDAEGSGGVSYHQTAHLLCVMRANKAGQLWVFRDESSQHYLSGSVHANSSDKLRLKMHRVGEHAFKHVHVKTSETH